MMCLQKLSLCQDLYGLHFQLLQLFEGYMKLVCRLTEKTHQVLCVKHCSLVHPVLRMCDCVKLVCLNQK